MYIQFYPTLRCNKACDFCFNKGLPFLPDMPLEQFRKMLGILKPAGVRTIDIMGGEPTLHPDIETMISDAEDAGFPVNISSNGTDLSMLERIITKNKRTTVGISVNERPELENMRGFIGQHHPVVKTVFRKGLDLAMADEILALRPKKFYLLFRDAMNAVDLRETVSFDLFLKTVGNLPQWKDHFTAKTQRARGKAGSLGFKSTNPGDLRAFAVQAFRFRSSSPVGTVFCSGFLPDVGMYPNLAHVRCPAGSTKLGVLPDGAVYPCNLFFGRREFLLGNLFTDPFKKIRDHPALAFFKVFTGNACPRISCRLHSQCHGGCPAQSLAHSGKLSASDPRCA